MFICTHERSFFFCVFKLAYRQYISFENYLYKYNGHNFKENFVYQHQKNKLSTPNFLWFFFVQCISKKVFSFKLKNNNNII
jgi:hypothetical protein